MQDRLGKPVSQPFSNRKEETGGKGPGRSGRLAGALGLIAWLAICGSAGLSPLWLPATSGTDMADTEYSASRALQHLKSLAAAPHPIGTPEHRAVRAYIVRELMALGLAPQVETGSDAAFAFDRIRAATVHNILVRLPGRERGKAVLVAGHYDTAVASPGAGDNGSAVASMLETLRALKAGPPLRNDLLFLFTDAEEVGRAGAEDLMRRSSFVSSVALVLNFDARGTSGPVLMFEASEGDRWLLDRLLAAAPSPVVYSYSQDAYRLLATYTDFTSYKGAGLPGLNFAFIGNEARYHTARDRLDQLDLRTLQHQGTSMLALARDFGNLDLRAPRRTGDAVYFNVAGSSVVVYPRSWTWPLTLAVAALAAGGLVLGLRRGSLTVAGTLREAGLHLLAALTAAVLIWGLGSLALGLEGLFEVTFKGMGGAYVLGCALIGAGIGLALRSALPGAREAEPVAGALLLWLALTGVAAWFLPGASYLFLAASASGGGSLLVLVLMPVGAAPLFRRTLLLAACAAPLLVLWIPVLVLLTQATGPWMAHLLAGLGVLLLGILTAQVDLLGPAGTWWRPAVATAVGLALLSGALLARFDADHPRPDTLVYGLDAMSSRAFWASFDEELDEWNSRFLPGVSRPSEMGDYFGTESTTLLAAPAPVLALPAPAIERIAEEGSGPGRVVRLRVAARRPAAVLRIALRSEAGLEAVTVAGERFAGIARPGSRGERILLEYHAPPAEGIELIVETRRKGPLTVNVVDRSFGLPLHATSLPARPASLMPSPRLLTDCTMVRKTATL